MDIFFVENSIESAKASGVLVLVVLLAMAGVFLGLRLVEALVKRLYWEE